MEDMEVLIHARCPHSVRSTYAVWPPACRSSQILLEEDKSFHDVTRRVED